jgi:hypothetical protein
MSVFHPSQSCIITVKLAFPDRSNLPLYLLVLRGLPGDYLINYRCGRPLCETSCPVNETLVNTSPVEGAVILTTSGTSNSRQSNYLHSRSGEAVLGTSLESPDHSRQREG